MARRTERGVNTRCGVSNLNLWSVVRKKVDEQAKHSREISQLMWVSDFNSGHGAEWPGVWACEKTGWLSEQGAAWCVVKSGEQNRMVNWPSQGRSI